MLHCLCKLPSIPLSFSLAAVLPRRYDHVSFFWSALYSVYRSQKVIHRLGRGLPGSLIPFAPHAFVFQRQVQPRELPSLLVFLRISLHFIAPPEIRFSSFDLKSSGLCNTYSFLKYFHCILLGPPTNPLRPIIPDNACPFRITAAAGTKFAGTSSTNSFIILFVERSLWTICPLPPRQIAGSGFRPLSNIPYCCLLSKFRPSLIPDVAIPPLRVAWDRRLGAPLPHQLPNPA